MSVQLSEERVMLIGRWHEIDRIRRSLVAKNEIDIVLLRKCEAQTKHEEDLTKGLLNRMDTVADLARDLDLIQHKISKLTQIETAIDVQVALTQMQAQAQAQQLSQQAQQAKEQKPKSEQPKLTLMVDDGVDEEAEEGDLVEVELHLIPDGEPMPEDDPPSPAVA